MRKYRGYFFAALFTLASTAFAGTAPGDVPPDSLGHDATGKALHVQDMHGKVVLITFWASWCGYCLKELPILAGIQKIAGPAQLQVVAVSYKEDYSKFLQIRHNLRKQDMLLAYDSDASVAKAYGISGIPHMVMIGRDGRIAYVHIGYDASMLDTIIAQTNTLLAAPAAAASHAP